MNESTPLFRSLSAVVAVILAAAAATVGLILGVFAFAVLSVACAMTRMKLWAAGGRRAQMEETARTGTVIEGRYEVLKE